MRGYLIDVENDRAQVVEVEDENHLKQFYELVGCDCIDIARRVVLGVPLNFVVDDEGFLKDGWRPSALDGPSYALCGNLLVFGVGPGMDLRSLTDNEVAVIELSLVNVWDGDNNWPAVVLG